MSDLPFDPADLEFDAAEELVLAYEALKDKFIISPGIETPFDKAKFDLLNERYHVHIQLSLKLNYNGNDFHLIFTRCHYEASSGNRDGLPVEYDELKIWAVVDLKKDFGRVMIRHETFADRVAGLIHPVELKFHDDKLFDRKFYVVANDRDKALNCIDLSFRNAIVDVEDENILIEIVDRCLLVGSNNWPDSEHIIQIAGIAAKIASLR